jgi:Tol biopolymer transport system component
MFSPDGRWIAYSSDDSGRNEIYVRPYPGPGGKIKISNEGGAEPAWSRDGRELFYRNGGKLMAVPMKIGTTLEPGVATPLFETNVVGFFSYDVSADGRFLLYTPGNIAAPAASPVTIVLNWQAGLKR